MGLRYSEEACVARAEWGMGRTAGAREGLTGHWRIPDFIKNEMGNHWTFLRKVMTYILKV